MSPPLFKIVLEVLANATKQEKLKTGIRIDKKKKSKTISI